MPHKYVTKEVLDRLRNQVTVLSNEIQDIRAIANKDRTGIDLFIKRVRQLGDSAKAQKDAAIDGTIEDGSPRYGQDGRMIPASLLEARLQDRMALIFRGAQKAYEAVLEMFESPDLAVAEFVKERDGLQKRLTELEAIERIEPAADNG